MPASFAGACCASSNPDAVSSSRRLHLRRWPLFGALAKTSILFGATLSVILLAGAVVARGQWRLGAAMLAGFGAGVALLWMAVGQNLWHLGPYVTNALALARGYNQTLHWEPLPSVACLGWLLMMLAVGVVIVRAGTAFEKQDKHRAWRRGLLLAWLVSLLFLTWKHGFVRGDVYHRGAPSSALHRCCCWFWRSCPARRGPRGSGREDSGRSAACWQSSACSRCSSRRSRGRCNSRSVTSVTTRVVW